MVTSYQKNTKYIDKVDTMILTEKILGQIIDDIQMLGIEADKIVITGSVALCAYGLKEEFNDVDIILINPTKDSYCELLSRYYKKMDGYYTVKVTDKTFPIDILRDDYSPEHPMLEIAEGIYLSTLDCVIKAKRGLNRGKDHNDFQMMVNSLARICGFEDHEQTGYALSRIELRLKIELDRQKRLGKKFLSDEDIDVLIDGIIREKSHD